MQTNNIYKIIKLQTLYRIENKKTSHIDLVFIGGDTQNRTEDKGVADPCLTAWLCRRVINFIYTNYKLIL